MTGRRESLVPERITVECRRAESRQPGGGSVPAGDPPAQRRCLEPRVPASARSLGWTTGTWALDLPGFGRSAGLAGPPTVNALADWLVDWLDAADIPEAHLLGCSFGCQVAVEAALRNPGRVRSLVLVGPTTDPRARSLPRRPSDRDPPEADGKSPEAEWGFDRSLLDDLTEFDDRSGSAVRRLRFEHPEQ
ncbi:alpha/beta fold hydrolase [Parasphingorhabdus pacifica]